MTIRSVAKKNTMYSNFKSKTIMETITKKEAVDALKKLFDYEAHREKKEVMVSEKENGDATFMVNKQYMERFEVIDRLQDFFYGKSIEGGQVRVGNITFVYTIFYVEDRSV